MHCIVYVKGADFFLSKVQTQILYFCFSDLSIQPILVCHVSNGRTQMFDQIYVLLVEFLPEELYSN